MTRLRIILHNVLHWKNRRFDLSNTYRRLDPDMILLTSYGLKTENKLVIPGYRVYKQNTSNEQMDGVALAVRTGIAHTIEDDFDSETLAATIHTSDGPLTIATTYLPPRRPYIPHPDFLRLLRRRSPVFLAGDLNARHPMLGTTTSNGVGRDLVQHYLRRQTARHVGPNFPTYHGPLTTSTPDIVLTNAHNHLFHSTRPGPLTSSDHIPVVLDISTSPILTPIPSRPDFHRADWDAFKEDPNLQMTGDHDISHGSLEDINNALESWTNSVAEAAARHVPRRRFKISPGPRPSRDTILTQLQFQALQQRAQRIGWELEDYRRYTQLRQHLHDLRRAEASRYWGKTLTDLTKQYQKPRLFWRKLRSLSGLTTSSSTYLIDDDGRRHHTNQEKERLFTAQWEEVFQEDEVDEEEVREVLDFMRANDHRTTPYPTADPTRLTGTSHLDCHISAEELRSSIRNSRETAPGCSEIGKTILLHLPHPALRRLARIYSAALSAGYFPDGLKSAVMRLIPKAGKTPTRAANFRPISLLEVHGKMLERVVTRRLRAHLEEENLLSPAQYGFRQGRGTIHAIAVATEALALHQAEGFRCNLVLRDVSKAFDKIWHQGLRYKILQLELPDPVARLLSNFLANRTARVKIGDHSGPWFPLHTGVPQGSVLSPLLYNIYTRDYPEALHGLNIQYADDVSQLVVHPGRSKTILNARTSRDIARVNAHEARWRIKTSIEKFTVVPVATHTPAPLIVDDDVVEMGHRGRLLGLSVSSRGYTSHITQRAGQARTALNRLYRFRGLAERHKLHLVKALIIPVLTYPPVPTHAMSRTSISRLQRVQNAALRFVYNVRWDDYITNEELHQRAGLPPLNIRLHEMAKKVWTKMEEEGVPHYQQLRDVHDTAQGRSQAWFPRSMLRLEQQPDPDPVYC